MNNHFTKIEDSTPEDRRLQAVSAFMTGGRIPDGEIMMMLRREQSEMAVRKFLECSDFFSVHIDQHGYGTMRLDAYVLTAEEYRLALKKAFADGISHANRFGSIGYMPMPPREAK